MSPFRSTSGLLVRLIARFKKFGADTNAAAAVEAALLFPVMITLYFGSVETSRLISYDRRINSAAATLGDLVARVKTSISEDDLNDLFVAATYTMIPYDAGTLKQIVTCVYVDADGNATVKWSYGYNGGSGHTEDASYDLPDEYIAIALDSYVIVSEAAITYSTISGLFFTDGVDLYKERFYVPRFGDYIDVTS